MHKLTLKFRSDACIASGALRPEEVDVELLHDDLGLPMVNGKALRALLRDTWLSMARAFPEYETVAVELFGEEGSLGEGGILDVRDARMGDDVCAWVTAALADQNLRVEPLDILHSLTTVRSQTAEERVTGAPARATLRRMRLLLKGTELTAPLVWAQEPSEKAKDCLRLVVESTYHMGVRRNRGLGVVEMSLGETA